MTTVAVTTASAVTARVATGPVAIAPATAVRPSRRCSPLAGSPST
ncbi:hypothetical protein [Leifsonia sp. 71-9]|nr:hypothetical protein [Leifsonia sp. 71-9]